MDRRSTIETRRRPNVVRYAEARDKKTWEWIESKVIPYLQSLLDHAQARLTRHKIAFNDGMGMSNFYLEPEDRMDRLDFATSNAAAVLATSYEPVGGRGLSARDRRYANRFPELVEFKRIINDLDEYLEQSIGEMESTGGGS